MQNINKDFLPIYQKVINWLTTYYKNNTKRWLDKEHAHEIFTFLNENSKHRKQDGTAAIISKFLEASLDETDKNKQYVKVGWTESSLRSMVYGDKVR